MFFFEFIILGPIYEEFIYRFLFIDKNRSFHFNIFMLIVSSLVFSYSHRYAVNSILGLVQFLFLGISLGVMYLKTKNIFNNIIIHSLYNALILTVSFIS